MTTNGSTEQQGAVITVLWDEKTQNVGLQFKQDEFRTWDFVVAVLDMARSRAEDQRRMAQVQAMQQQISEHARLEQIRRTLRP